MGNRRIHHIVASVQIIHRAGKIRYYCMFVSTEEDVMDDRNELRIKKFKITEKEYYELWMLRSTAVLESKNLSEVVFEVPNLLIGTVAEDRKRNSKMRKENATIVTSLGDKILSVVQKVSNPSDLIAKLNERCAVQRR